MKTTNAVALFGLIASTCFGTAWAAEESIKVYDPKKHEQLYRAFRPAQR